MQYKKAAPERGAQTWVPCLIAGIAASGLGFAEIENDLEPTVISATRMETPLPHVGSAVSLVDPEALQARGIRDLQSALDELPGVIATSTSGQRGAIGSLFIRGTVTDSSQIVVDGVRLSDSTSPLGNFLGSSNLAGFGRIEVLRGPQSALYGGEAIGGVVSLTTAHGEGSPGGRLILEAGSFGSYLGAATFDGEIDGLSYFLGTHYEETQNDRKQNDFHQFGYALRVDQQVSDDLRLGLTTRGADNRYESPTSLDHLDSSLVTLYADARLTPTWESRLILGRYQESYDSDDAFGNYGTDLERLSVSLDNQLQLGERHRVSFGGFFENTDYFNTIGTDQERDRHGAHLGWEWAATDEITTYLATRWEDYAAYGDEFTYRAALAYRVPRSGTILRGSYGRAFRAPSYLDLFGTNWGAGNPGLSAETSHGWDFGIEQPFARTHSVSLTWFENRIEDRIQAFPTPPVNLPGTTETRGLEAALQGSFPGECWSYRASYTWLARSLQDQPEQTANVSIDFRPSDPWLLGAGAAFVDSRSYGGSPLDDYFLLRFYGSYQATRNVRLHARIENALDQDYELSDFFGTRIDGRGFGIFAGVTVEW